MKPGIWIVFGFWGLGVASSASSAPSGALGEAVRKLQEHPSGSAVWEVFKAGRDDPEAAADAVGACLTHDDPGVRVAAAAALWRLGLARFADRIAPLLSDERPEVRREAVVALVSLRDPRSGDRIGPLLGDPDAWMRRLAVEALAEMGWRPAAQVLVGLLEDPEETVQWAAVEALGKLTDENAAARVRELLLTEDPDLWRRSTLCLGLAGDASQKEQVVRLLRDSDWRVREMSLRVLARLLKGDRTLAGVAAPYLVGPYSNVSVAAVEAIIASQDRSVRPSLHALLSHANPRARAVAILALGGLGDPGDAERIAPMLADPDPTIRYAALHALTGAKPPSFGRRWGMRGREERWDPWEDVLPEIAGIRPDHAIPCVAKLLEGDAPETLAIAAKALEGLTGQRWDGDVEAARAWWARHKDDPR